MGTNVTPLTLAKVDDRAGPDDTVTVTPRTTRDDTLAEEELAGNIGRYVVIERVGRGGMGSVYRAYDPGLQREVAVKRLRRDALDAEGKLRLEEEARAMAALSHPNVVAVYDVEPVDDNEVVLVMEFVSGPTLRAWLRESDRVWSDTLVPFLEAGRGLAAAHRAGLLHRDFKPDNVLVSAQGAKVTDFGIAKRTTQELELHRSSSGDLPQSNDLNTQELTRAGVVMGTPRYMAPEQHAGDVELTPAADQFAFCVSLWEALTRSRAYKGFILAPQKAKGPPPWPNDRGPRWLGDALRRGMSPKPDERWPSMDALVEELSRDVGAARRRILRAAAAVAILGTASVGGYYGLAHKDPCEDVRGGLDSSWNDDIRSRVHESMGAVDVAYAESVSTRVVSRLDRYSGAWAAERHEACEASPSIILI